MWRGSGWMVDDSETQNWEETANLKGLTLAIKLLHD
jgi:hypothetical protein